MSESSKWSGATWFALFVLILAVLKAIDIAKWLGHILVNLAMVHITF